MVLYPFGNLKNLQKFVQNYMNSTITDLGYSYGLLNNKSSSFYSASCPIPRFAVPYIAEKILESLNAALQFDPIIAHELGNNGRHTPYIGERMEHILVSFRKIFLLPNDTFNLDADGYLREEFKTRKKLSNAGMLNLLYLLMKKIVDERKIRLDSPSSVYAFLDFLKQHFELDKPEYYTEIINWDEIVEYFTNLQKDSPEQLDEYKKYNEVFAFPEEINEETRRTVSFRDKTYKKRIRYDKESKLITLGDKNMNIKSLFTSLFIGEKVWPLLRYNIEITSKLFTGMVPVSDMEMALQKIMEYIVFLKQSVYEKRDKHQFYNIFKSPILDIYTVCEFEFFVGLSYGVDTDDFKKCMQALYDTAILYKVGVSRDVRNFIVKSFPFLIIDKPIDSLEITRIDPRDNPFQEMNYVGVYGNDEYPPKRVVLELDAAKTAATAATGGSSASSGIESFFSMYFC